MLDDYLRVWIGEVLLRAGDATAAGAWFESVGEAVPDTLQASRAVWLAGEAWFRAGQCKRVIEQLAPVSKSATLDPAAPAALLSLAECQARENRSNDAQVTLRHLWIKFPAVPESTEAYRRLSHGEHGGHWQPTQEDRFLRGLAMFNQSLLEGAVDELKKYLTAGMKDHRRMEAKLKLGIALVRLKRYDEAKPVFQEVSQANVTESGEATVWLARAYLRQKDGDRLVALQERLPHKHLSREQQGSIHMFAGIWYDDQGKSDSAIHHFRRMSAVTDSVTQRAEAQWRIGWIHYRQGRMADALTEWQTLTEVKDGSLWDAQGLYWSGRAWERQGDVGRAGSLYRHLCSDYPYSYYCQQVRVLPDGSQYAPSVMGVPVATQAMGPSPRLGREVHYQRGIELRWLGREQEAGQEFASLADRYLADRGALVELTTLLREAGAYHFALRLARQHFREPLERGGDPVPVELWKAAYPVGYVPIIRDYAVQRVDPYLVSAIIREESQYDPRAVSRVGAIGLMQVMPTTAQQVARRLGVPDPGRDQLFDYATNLRVGTTYIAELLEQFHGNTAAAIASYNAGPQIVSEWMTKFGQADLAEFVELIPYQETRQYVKRVLRSYREYQRVAPLHCDPTFLDKVC
jgi:soluble lytic murein transglycosylase